MSFILSISAGAAVLNKKLFLAELSLQVLAPPQMKKRKQRFLDFEIQALT